MKPDKKEHIVYDSIYTEFWKMQTNLEGQRQIIGCLGSVGEGQCEAEGRDYKGPSGNFGGDEYVHYLDCSDVVINIYTLHI